MSKKYFTGVFTFAKDTPLQSNLSSRCNTIVRYSTAVRYNVLHLTTSMHPSRNRKNWCQPPILPELAVGHRKIVKKIAYGLKRKINRSFEFLKRKKLKPLTGTNAKNLEMNF